MKASRLGGFLFIVTYNAEKQEPKRIKHITYDQGQT